MIIGIIGIGLIGGSMAIDLKKRGFASAIIGVDNNEQHEKKALELGLVDETTSVEDCAARADLLIIAIPVNHSREVILKVLDNCRAETVVLDVGSTKSGICEVVRNHPKRGRFVAGHPIAGTEYSGPESAFSGLFDGKLNIICDIENSDQDALDRVYELSECLKMNIKKMEAKDHDKHLAYVSHLSHISSFALGITVLDIEKDEKNILDLAGSGFSSTVRLAKSSPDMWTPILMHNSEYLISALDEFIDQLHDFKTLLKFKKEEELHGLMAKANKVQSILEKEEE